MFLSDKFNEIAPNDKNVKIDCSEDNILDIKVKLIKACFESLPAFKTDNAAIAQINRINNEFIKFITNHRVLKFIVDKYLFVRYLCEDKKEIAKFIKDTPYESI